MSKKPRLELLKELELECFKNAQRRKYIEEQKVQEFFKGFDEGLSDMKTYVQNAFIRGDFDAKQEEPTVKSHSEQDILNGCIMLMGRVYESMIEFMDLHDFDFHRECDGTCDERYPKVRMSATEIVNVLFLYKTNHSGGTSTLAKAREFDLKDGEEIIFTPHVEED